MGIPKGILATDKWFSIVNFAGNGMDTTSNYNSSSNIPDTGSIGKIVYSDNSV